MRNLFLPHRFDRYRMVGLILHYLLERQPELNQLELERATGIDQTTISRFLDFDKLKEKAKKKKGLSRRTLLALTRKGIKLSHKQASLLLWLSEGPAFIPWRNEELGRERIPQPNDQDATALEDIAEINAFNENIGKAHLETVQMLRAVFVAKELEDGWRKVETNILHGNMPKDYLALYRKLRDMEWRAGQRMLVSKYPSILVSTDITNASIVSKDTSEPFKRKLHELLTQRQVTFKENLKKFGERTIHSVTSIKRFANASFKHPLRVEERRKRVRGLIKYLEAYPLFQVGLIPETERDIEPEVEIAIKSTREAVVRGTTRELSNHPETVVCGPSYVHWDDEWAVITFYLDFEHEWEKIWLEGYTEKPRVLDILERILRDAGRS
jgi:hypothetical protein